MKDTYRDQIIAKVSFRLLDLEADNVTVGTVRELADDIIGLLYNQTEGDFKISEPQSDLRRECGDGIRVLKHTNAACPVHSDPPHPSANTCVCQSLDALRLEAATRALALNDLLSSRLYEREHAEDVVNEKWRDWQDDAEACIRAYLGSES